VKNKRDKSAKSKIRRIYQIVFSLGILILLYYLRFPIYYIGIMAGLIVVLILVRGKVYMKIDHLLTRFFPFLSNAKPVVRKIILIVIFVLFWILLKQAILFMLKLAGIDMQEIANNVSKSMVHGSSSSSGSLG
jgi:hypothetical protein